MTARRKPDLAAVFGLLAPAMREATVKAHEALVAAGIRHVLVGGLAVGAHGVPRATKDVDFLVGDEAFVEHAGGLVTLHPGLPIAIGGIPVDAVPIPKDAPFLADALSNAAQSEGVPVAGVETLVCMKLLASRARDRADIEDLLAAGADAASIRAYVAQHLSDHLADFESIARSAEARR
jgi:hypothetical protein